MQPGIYVAQINQWTSDSVGADVMQPQQLLLDPPTLSCLSCVCLSIEARRGQPAGPVNTYHLLLCGKNVIKLHTMGFMYWVHTYVYLYGCAYI